MRNIIVVRPLCGLCNRMQAIVSVLQLAKSLNRKCVIIWMIEPGLNARFSDLFEDFPFRIITVTVGTWQYSLLNNVLKRIFYYVDDYDGYGVWVGAYYKRWQDSLLRCNPLYICTGENVINTRVGFDIFKPNKDIKGLMNIGVDKSFIGIHIRRTDNDMSKESSPTGLFVEAMRYEIEKDPLVHFYLATDDLNEETRIKNLFPDRVYCYNKRSLSRDCKEGIQDAVVDLYNLSRCKRIYGSYKSSFSIVASLWGNTEIVILSKD